MARLRIAISGGGIASLCLAHGLIGRREDVDIRIFEGSPEFRDEGAAIGLDSNAQTALQLLSPALKDALTQAGGVPMEPSFRIMIGTGPDSGRHVADYSPSVPKIVVHRGSFWHVLRKGLQEDILVMGKKLTSANQAENGAIRLQFEDGTWYEADALIGCDGINSPTRRAVLGDGHPAVNPITTPGYAHRVVIPIDTAIGAFGKEYCERRTQQGWVGKNGYHLTDLVDGGSAMQVIAGWITEEPWQHSAPFVEWPKERLESDLAGWGKIGRGLLKVFTDQPKLYAGCGRAHLDTEVYCKGSICIAGDAAQTFAPFYGAGAAQAMEDALMLATVLSVSHGREDVVRAFQIYDMIRRPRRQEVARRSNWAANLFTGRDPSIGLDVHALAKAIEGWGEYVIDYDVAGDQERARKLIA